MDGWNEEKVQDVIEVLDELYNLSYELKNCIRGCYTGCNTYEELQDHVNSLADRLHNAAEWMDTTEDEEEEED